LAFFPPDPPGAVAVDRGPVVEVVVDEGAVVVEVGLVTVDVVVEDDVGRVVVDVGATTVLVVFVVVVLAGLAGAGVVDVVEVVVTGGRTAVVLVVVGADLVVLAGLAGAVVVVEATGSEVVVAMGAAMVVLETEPLALAAAEAWGTPMDATAPRARRPVTRTVLNFGPRPTHWRTCIVRISARNVTICSDLAGRRPSRDEGPPGQPDGENGAPQVVRGRASTGGRYCRPRVSATWWSSDRKSGWAMSARAWARSRTVSPVSSAAPYSVTTTPV
jgi:hypothetical protein